MITSKCVYSLCIPWSWSVFSYHLSAKLHTHISSHLPEPMMHFCHKTLRVTINDQCDVESPLQRSSTVPQHHRVEPRILLTNILNLQSMVKVYLHLFHLELRAVGYLLALFKPAQTHTLENRSRHSKCIEILGQPGLTTVFRAWGRQTRSLVIWKTSGQQLPPPLVHFCS